MVPSLVMTTTHWLALPNMAMVLLVAVALTLAETFSAPNGVFPPSFWTRKAGAASEEVLVF